MNPLNPTQERCIVRLWKNLKLRYRNWRVRHIAKAYHTLSKALQDDPDFARSWHANIAMPIYDTVNRNSVEPVMSIQEANAIADKLMLHLFDVNKIDSP